MRRDRHMFEVEQVDYEREKIDWSYITFNDNKVQYSTVPLASKHQEGDKFIYDIAVS